MELRIILDIIVIYSCDNWGYVPPGGAPQETRDDPLPTYLPWSGFYGSHEWAETREWQVAWWNETLAKLTLRSDEIIGRPDGI